MLKLVESLHFKQKVYCFWLLIVVNELWNYLVNQVDDVFNLLFLFHASLILFSDLASQTAEILVTPANKVAQGSLEAVLESIVILLL